MRPLDGCNRPCQAYCISDVYHISNPLVHKNLNGRSEFFILKARKRAKVRNRYNQAPHLTQDTNGNVTTLQLDITNESQEVSSFQAGDHKASINRRARKHNKTRQKQHK